MRTRSVIVVLMGLWCGLTGGFAMADGSTQAELRQAIVELEGAWIQVENASWQGALAAGEPHPRPAYEAALARVNELVARLGPEAVRVKTVEDLKKFLPGELAGFSRVGMEGSEEQIWGLNRTSAKARYESDDGTAGFDVVLDDFGVYPQAGGYYLDWSATAEEDTRPDGYQRTWRAGDRWIHEEWSAQARAGRHALIVADRYRVTVEGANVTMERLREAAAKLDPKRLASSGRITATH